ncbi:MAG TPA: hypothetical protein VI457_08835 [Methylococcaceae bacterium]|nr:hypothetical protein [Methylococcaceae bacterium]
MGEPLSARERQSCRRLLAQEAARILSCEGINDYGTARRRAASRLGIAARRHWPSDEEILDAVREWQRIYRFNQGKDHLNRLRRLACEAMEFLEGFSPRLTGCVATGAAGDHASITLEVFADPAEDVLKKLVDARIPYTLRCIAGQEKGIQDSTRGSEIRFFVDGIAMELRVWPDRYRCRLPKSKEFPRLTLREVRQLLEDESRTTEGKD